MNRLRLVFFALALACPGFGHAQPIITIPPQNRTVRVGDSAFFAVTTTGTPPLTYQWRKDGADLLGATGAALALGLARTDMSGNYSAVVTDTTGSVTSSPAVLSIEAAAPGAVAAWGYNGYQQTLVPPAAQGGITAVAAGRRHTAALTSDGAVVVWGDNALGQINVPGAAQSGVASIAAGTSHMVALRVDGSVVAWGFNSLGQTTVPGAAQSGVVAVAGGDAHTVALKTDGSVIVWGWNRAGQATVPPAAQHGVVAVAAGNEHTIALKNDGSVVAWGSNGRGQATVPLAARGGVVAIAAGGENSVALTSDGSVVAWGDNSWGQTTVPLAAQGGVVAIAAGGFHTVALRADGSVLAWGCNLYGEAPGIVGLTAATAIASGAFHSVAIERLTAPIIVTPPANQTINAGQTASFTVAAAGPYLAYQWRKDGVNIPGATDATYFLNSVRTHHAGDYTVVVSNFAGSVTSTPPATLTVIPAPPVIVTPPASLTVNLGQSASFTVTAAGYALSFQWRKNGGDIPRGTNATYVIPSVRAEDTAGYTVVVSNPDGSVTSAPPAVLTMTTFPPVILNPPTNLTVNAGQTASFTVVAALPPFTYQWRKDGVNLFRATNATYVLNSARTNHAGDYTVVVSNPAGSVTSTPPATLTLTTFPPVILNPPTNLTVNAGQTASFTVVAAFPPFTYRWRKDGVDILGATGATCAFGLARINQTGSYTVVVGNPVGSVTNALPAELTVIRRQSGGNGIVVAWEFSGNGQTIVPVEAQSGVAAIAAGSYHTVALKTDGSVVAWGSNGDGQATVPVVARNGVVAIAAGGIHTVALKDDGSVVAWGDNRFGQTTVPVVAQSRVAAISAGYAHTVALKTDGSVVAWGNNFSGQTNVPVAAQRGVVAIAAGGDHTVALKADGSVVAWGGNRTGQTTVPVSAQSGVVAIAAGGIHTVALKHDGSVVAWGYNFSGQTVPGAAQSDVAAIAAGTGHTVALKNDGSVVAWGDNGSGEATVPVAAQRGVLAIAAGGSHTVAIVTPTIPTITAQPASQTVAAGDTVMFDVQAASLPPPTYQWQFNGVDIPGATDRILQLNNVARSQAGRYTVAVSNEAGSVTSTVATLTVNFIVQFRSTRSSISETNQVAAITVDRTGDGPEIVTVIYATADGTATAGQDYTAVNGTLTFGPGDTTRTFTMPLLDDNEIERGETVFLTLSNLTGPAVFGANTRAVVSLVDDDTPPLTNLLTTAIAAGDNHTLVLRQDGSLWAWGDNRYGQLGDGTTDYRTDPVLVDCSINNWSAVAAGDGYSVALKKDGSLWAWGANWDGQLGIGRSGEPVLRPVRVDPNLTWSAIAVGRNQTLAIRMDGSLWTWGRGVPAPERVGADNDWRTIAAGRHSSLGLRTDGSLWALDNSLSASAVGADQDWVTVTAGGFDTWGNSAEHVVAFKTDGGLWAWGANGSGQLGDGSTAFQPDPVRIGADNDWVAITAGRQHTLALKRDGTLWGWGDNNQRQLGDGTRLTRLEPSQIGLDNDWIAVDAGGDRSVALKSDGSLWWWGAESPSFRASLLRIAAENDWSVLAAGGNQSLAIRTNGSLWAWGDGRAFPARVEGAENLQAVAAGISHALALRIDGSLWARGENGIGQLGDGTYEYRTSLVRIGADDDWSAIVAGNAHSLALKSDGSLWAWGANWSGQLGNGTTLSTNTPQRIGSSNDWIAAAAGYEHAVGLKGDGSLWAWGANWEGQLGIGTSGNLSSAPVRVGLACDWRAVGAGAGHTVALKSDGSLWTWGFNSNGQLGDDSSNNRSSPGRVGSDNDWVMITAGGFHALALKTDGSLWAWGNNYSGQLGLGSPSGGALRPFRVGADNDWLRVAAGASHTLALKADGSLWAWGDNYHGQLGDPTGWVPTRVGADNDWGLPSSGTSNGAVRFTGGTLQPGGRLDLFFATTLRDSYYLLQRGDSPATIQQTVWATLGDCDPRVLADPTPVAFRVSAFYRIRAVPLAQPIDSDGDGIDDVYELRHRVVLNPLNASDATEDFDGDGRSNLQEYRDGTDPAQVRQIVASGLNYTVALKTDGSLWAWGENAAGQLGDGTTNSQPAPVRIGTDTDWSSVSVGRTATTPVGYAGHTLALKKDGSLWAWGANYSGQLGTETSDGYTNRPVRVSLDNDWSQIAAGSIYTLALKRDGSLWGWGGNNWGVLGCCAGGTVPVRLGNSTDWQTVAAGGQHVLALKTDGSLWAWGNNESGQLGLDTGGGALSEPTRVDPANDWAAIAASGDDDIFDGAHSLALKSDGTLWAWGQNQWGNLGIGSTGDSWINPIPTQVGTNANWAALAVSGGNSMARQRDGNLWIWGFGIGDHPVPLGTNEVWRAFAVGGSPNYAPSGFATALKTDGSLWFSTFEARVLVPTVIEGDSDWAHVVAVSFHSLALKTNGTLAAWGANWSGQLGDGTMGTNRRTPVIVDAANNWSAIAAGGSHTLGLQADGGLWAWGANERGQLGDGTSALQLSPARIGSASDWVAIAAGDAHSAALKTDGSLWTWGSNFYGQLGDGTTNDHNVPLQVGTGNDWSVVAAQGEHTVALKSDGSLWAWGTTLFGPARQVDVSPVRIGSDNNWSALAAGHSQALALKRDGSLWMWGGNQFEPVRIGADNDWATIAVGGDHTLGLKLDGTLWAWGGNYYGQLGDGTVLNNASPVRIGAHTDWAGVAAGSYHSLARKANGSLWAWGLNGFGQLGIPPDLSPHRIGTDSDWGAPAFAR